MTEFRITHDWLSAGLDEPALRETTAQLEIHVGDVCLTRNEDLWSRTLRDWTLVSTYPLAMWMAASWWRLSWEPMPRTVGPTPGHDWRMAHELTAVGHGFVWPTMVCASDGEAVNIWAAPSARAGESVTYVNGLEMPQAVRIEAFQRSLDHFIDAVVQRLLASGCKETDLEGLWRLVQEERRDPGLDRMRRLEAVLGFDPGECPPALLERATSFQQSIGAAAMSELAPVFSQGLEGGALADLSDLIEAPGLSAVFQVKPEHLGTADTAALPWQQGVTAARQLRQHLGINGDPLSGPALCGLLGLSEIQVEGWTGHDRLPAAIARPDGRGATIVVPRRRHPVAKRFECARLIADHLKVSSGPDTWLAATDLATARQKYQRAFAAELLCPAEALVAHLDGRVDESALEHAALHFGVSEQTVRSLLMSHGHIAGPAHGTAMPYRLSAA